MVHTYSHLYKLPTCRLRFFTAYGPWDKTDKIQMDFTSAIMEGRCTNLFNYGEISRYFSYIDDIVKVITINLNNPPTSYIKSIDREIQLSACNHVFNIGNGSPAHLLGIIEVIKKDLDMKVDTNLMEMQLVDIRRIWAHKSQLNVLDYESITNIKTEESQFVGWFKIII